MNIKDVLIKNKYKLNKLFIFTDELINKILNVIYIKDVEKWKETKITNEDVALINVMLTYLNNYDKDNINEDFFSEFKPFCNGEKSIEFYIYFIHLYFKWTREYNIYTNLFVRNINILFYFNDIESIFNQEKFKLHYSDAFTGDVDLNKEVSSEIVEYVAKNLPNNLENDLEISIAIYTLLSKVLRYSPIYTLHEDFYETNKYEDVTFLNNEVVCVHFSIIYHKLLKMYGIDSNLAGDLHSHMYVNLNFGTMMIRADATSYGNFESYYHLSDMTNLKYDFMIEGFSIFNSFYGDLNYSVFNKERLEEIIKKVYYKMGIPINNKEKLSEYVDRCQVCEFNIRRGVNKEDIDRRVDKLNVLPLITNGTVEEVQFYNMLVVGMFFDIMEERVESLSLYKNDNGKVKLSKILVVYDEDGLPYYYFFRDGKLVNYNVDQLINIIIDEDWRFKHLTDIDAFSLEDEKSVYKLMR